MEVVAFVSQYSKSPRCSIFLFGVFLYTYSEKISELVFLTYLIDEIVILKNLWMGLNSKLEIKSCCLF